jgi:hypothetical protein
VQCLSLEFYDEIVESFIDQFIIIEKAIVNIVTIKMNEKVKKIRTMKENDILNDSFMQRVMMGGESISFKQKFHSPNQRFDDL